MSSSTPRLTLGLPVYNGEGHLAASLDAIAAQTFTDYELIISDNCSTDSTAEIASRYAAADPRVRYVRHEQNRGAAFNHNFVVEEARGEYFKWVSDDDLYHPELLRRCVEALDARPEVVVAHAWTAIIDESGAVTRKVDYQLVTDVPEASRRFHSLLYTPGGDDIYGVIRTSTLRRIAPYGSFHHPDRTFVAELALQGRFHNHPDHLYFRRDHPQRVGRANSIRDRATRADPRRADRWRNPTVRLVGEYLWAYSAAIWRAPLSTADRVRCATHLTVWLLGHANPLHRLGLLGSPDPAARERGERSLAARIVRHRIVPAPGQKRP